MSNNPWMRRSIQQANRAHKQRECNETLALLQGVRARGFIVGEQIESN